MNVYLIDDNEENHELLPEVLKACNESVGGEVYKDGFCGQGNGAWNDRAALKNALIDHSGIFLLDLHLPSESTVTISEQLLAEFEPGNPTIRNDFNTLWQKFDRQPAFCLGACLLAVVKGLNLCRIVTSTDKRELDGDKNARELAGAVFRTEFRTSGFPKPFNSDDSGDAVRVATHQVAIQRLATEIVDECDNPYDRAERAWAALHKQLNKGPWPDHPCPNASCFFETHPYHTVAEWHAILARFPGPGVNQALKTADTAREMLQCCLSKLGPPCPNLPLHEDVIVVLRSAFIETRSAQHMSLVLVKHLLPNLTINGRLANNNHFLCLRVPTQQASKMGRLLQAFWTLGQSTGNDTAKKFDGEISILDKTAKIMFSATMVDEATATESLEKLEGKKGRLGTAGKAIREMRQFTNVSGLRTGSIIFITAEFGLASVE